MAESNTFGAWVKQRRRTLDMTQADLARLARCAVITIQKLEAGERRPSKQIALTLADCLAIPPDERAAFVSAARDTTPASVEPVQAWPVALPVPPTPLLGRDVALADLVIRLRTPGIRLLTLIGPPGVGKTRLAIALAAEIAPDVGGDVVFIVLQAMEDADLVMPTIARTLELRESPNIPVLQRLHEALRERQLLLVLDNFEQVATAAPDLAALLAGCPHLRLVVTSRIALHLQSEHLYTVEPLAVPPSAVIPSALRSYSAATLFIARAQTILSSFEPTTDNTPTIAAVCAQLEGMPLALELAATRLKVLALPALLARLEHQLPLLAQDQRDVPPRHQTLRRAIEWSYTLLPPAAQTVMQHIAVCRSGCTAEAAAALLDLTDVEPWMLDMLTVLLDHSLVRRTDGESTELRFTMLASIREYAVEQLQEHADAEAVFAHHAHYYLRLAEQAEPELKGPDQVRWLARLSDEHDNLRVALEWAWKHQEQAIGLRLGGALAWFWFVRGYLSEGRRWLERFLDMSGDEPPPRVAALALRGVALLCHAQGAYQEARHSFEQSLDIYLRLGDVRLAALVRNNLGLTAYKQQRFDDARALYTASLAQFHALDDIYGVASIQNNLGNMAVELEDYQTALTCYTESLACYRALGHTRGIASVLGNLGDVALHDKDFGRAHAAYTESITIYRTLGDQMNLAVALSNLADLALRMPDAASIRRAARLYGASEALRKEIGSPQTAHDVQQQQENIARFSVILPRDEFAHAWEEGSAWSFEDALAYAVAPDEQLSDVMTSRE